MTKTWTKTLLCLLCSIFLMAQAMAFGVGSFCAESVSQPHAGHHAAGMEDMTEMSNKATNEHNLTPSKADCCDMDDGGSCSMAHCITAIPAPGVYFSAFAAFPVAHHFFSDSYTSAPPVVIDRPPIFIS